MPRRTTASNVFLDHANGVAIVAVRARSSGGGGGLGYSEGTDSVDGGYRNSAGSGDDSSLI